MSIAETSDLYAAYIKGWDAALRNAAMSFWGADRDAILALLKGEEEPRVAAPDYCPEKLKPGGCQLHNLHCGFPACNKAPRKAA